MSTIMMNGISRELLGCKLISGVMNFLCHGNVFVQYIFRILGMWVLTKTMIWCKLMENGTEINEEIKFFYLSIKISKWLSSNGKETTVSKYKTVIIPIITNQLYWCQTIIMKPVMRA